MKLNTAILLAFASTAAPTFATDSHPLTPSSQVQLCMQEDEEEGEGVCENGECEIKSLTKEEAAAFLKEKMPFMLKEFNEFVESDPDEEDLEDLLFEITSLQSDFQDLNEFKPELAALMIEVEKLDYEMNNILNNALEKGKKPEEAMVEIKDIFTTLFTKRIQLEKGRIEQAKLELKQEEADIEALEKDKEEAIKKELEELLNLLKEETAAADAEDLV